MEKIIALVDGLMQADTFGERMVLGTKLLAEIRVLLPQDAPPDAPAKVVEVAEVAVVQPEPVVADPVAETEPVAPEVAAKVPTSAGTNAPRTPRSLFGSGSAN